LQDFRQLKVWENGHTLALAIYANVDEVKRMLSSLIRTIEGETRPQVREASPTYN